MKSKRGTYVLAHQLPRHPGLSQVCLGRWSQMEVLRSSTASWLDCLGMNPAPLLTSSDLKSRENTRTYLMIVKRIKLLNLTNSKCCISSINKEVETMCSLETCYSTTTRIFSVTAQNIRFTCIKPPTFDFFFLNLQEWQFHMVKSNRYE